MWIWKRHDCFIHQEMNKDFFFSSVMQLHLVHKVPLREGKDSVRE